LPGSSGSCHWSAHVACTVRRTEHANRGSVNVGTIAYNFDDIEVRVHNMGEFELLVVYRRRAPRRA
jgi:hypothetical protein